ncbi:DEAD/DEAH box helicase [Corynebacterium mastitidis]|uniref:DEAD/DEAH box helicase n=1 Tax=Corynebacterium mastitidis TaxID=161890 RepID=UPI0025515104|nr:DEAD/DEAH box helicase [Corynebacterium mastitidis]MDK8450809.1 DEAD/DEAH box helicase [Corynebacterium mastitidis]
MSAGSNNPTFAELGVAVEITEALKERGIERTFAIQELTTPRALDGRDIIGQARTGMGKTYGYGVPLLDRVFDAADVPELNGTPRALVVAPTRELADQVGEDLRRAAAYLPVNVVTIVGGRGYEEQIDALRAGADVVVGTPGRLLDLHASGPLDLSSVAILVLDEADEMLNLGFLPDVEKIMAALTHAHQTMLFSATMPGPILALARGFMDHPLHIRAELGEDKPTHDRIRQVVFQAHQMDKPAVVARILQAPGRGRTIVFARTKRAAARLAEDLAQAGFRVGAVHGDLPQHLRERSLQAFRDRQCDILVATDVAARGIDVDDVTHVINYQVPDDPMTYIHRIGRTGRAGHSGTAVTLVGYDELGKWRIIDEEHALGLPQPERWFSTSPELAQAFGIDPEAGDSVGPPRRVFGNAAAAGPANAAGAAGSGRARTGAPQRGGSRRGGKRRR